MLTVDCLGGETSIHRVLEAIPALYQTLAQTLPGLGDHASEILEPERA